METLAMPTKTDKVFYRNAEHRYVWNGLTREQVRGIIQIFNPDTLEDLSIACSFIIGKDNIVIAPGVFNVNTGTLDIPKYDRLFVSIIY